MKQRERVKLPRCLFRLTKSQSSLGPFILQRNHIKARAEWHQWRRHLQNCATSPLAKKRTTTGTIVARLNLFGLFRMSIMREHQDVAPVCKGAVIEAGRCVCKVHKVLKSRTRRLEHSVVASSKSLLALSDQGARFNEALSLVFSTPVHISPNPLSHLLFLPPLSLPSACISCFIFDRSLCSHLDWCPDTSPRWIIAQRTEPPTRGRITSSPRGPWCSSLERRLKVREKKKLKYRERCPKIRTQQCFCRDYGRGDRR